MKSDTMRQDNGLFSPPPEGVLRGESVPACNDEHRLEDSKVEKVANKLKLMDRYSDAKLHERKEKAREIINKVEQ